MPKRSAGAPSPVTAYHAHVYYDPSKTRDRAEHLRERVAAEFPGAKLGRWHDELVGPHTQSMYQIAFPTDLVGVFPAVADAQSRRADSAASPRDRR